MTQARPDARRLSVLGAGSWGTALALVLARNHHEVALWGHRPAAMQAMARQRHNPDYLSDIPLPPNIHPHASLGASLADTDAVLVVVPSAAFAGTLQRLADELPPHCPVIWATKGLDETGQLLHVTAERLLPGHPLGVLSGPSFAGEVAAGLPTAVALASHDAATGEHLAEAFRDERFRVYTSDDVIGVELGGAVKNVLAIATGIADGMGFGANARAGLITRGLAETRRLGARIGARDETLTGLAGMGDLILTCTDDQSRNRRLGLALGRGEPMARATGTIGQVVEGTDTATRVMQLAAAHDVEMPICAAVKAVVAGDLDPAEATRALLQRPPRRE
ncbi:NAD(P)H-dependent glycerol-3-phosphate dehydrogenase [Spiribacter pallidus]|uniref:Glycerol-3-phosphate dehydrogenase [NAD(P)+] n=1 Tax=Spiribacter pallidus TaxID=1987936 RepID=A0ABV3TD25_9GAMM